jgi:methylamine utilization protein MauE
VRVAYVEVACRVTLLGVLAVAALPKLRGRQGLVALAGSLVAMRLVRPGRGQRVAVLLVLAEVGTVALLGVVWAPVLGFAAAAALLAVLTAGVVRVLRRGAAAPCRCFGASAMPVSRVHAVRNAGLCALAVAGGVAAVAGGTGEPPGFVVAGAIGGVAAVLVVVLDDVVELFRPAKAGLGKGGV